ncbi:hypothetical protein SUGI_0894570 [Cryptomeria japonica]|uniref:phospholipase A1-Igamma1, chloroplastic-like n=1 Tax=Cryptomeria japonica TaxID=3369 RepID=UPI0024146898|nr:phospholipase A1-Igamma1, chloroplastic-like [Cryptomeria japonica]GLJ43105.1 hypothetical protein SUGI_0894570 [Cryptomeria japonica]
MAPFPLPTLTVTNSSIERSQPQLCDIWRDIQGANNWNGFLDPMNPILKGEALRYGDFAQLCYDAFDGESYSKYYGTCKQSKRDLFNKMGMSGCGYEVTKYIYANTTGLSRFFGEKSKGKYFWIGFIAVSTDPKEIKRLGRRDIVIAWRGTQTFQEWMQDLHDFLVPTSLSYKSDGHHYHQPHGIRIERGFRLCYTSTIGEHENSQGKMTTMTTRDLLIEEVNRLLKVYENDIANLSITFCGHSLGAALATFSAYDVKQMLNNNHLHDIPVTVFSFASPRVGNLAFAKQVEKIGVKVLRFVNKRDVVPQVPGVFMNEKMGWLSKLLNWLPWTYFHVGVEVSLANNSPHLDHTCNLAYLHNLEVYLHLLDGYVGRNKPYCSSGRDVALVNKKCDIITEKLGIPPHWWQLENKGLIKGTDGKWRQPTRSIKIADSDEE